MNFPALLAVLLFSLFLSGPGHAQDECQKLVERARKETSLIKKSAILEEAVFSCPRDPEVIYKYAYSLERLRKYEKALRYYQKAAELDPGNAKYFFGMGDMLRHLKRTEEAVRAYRRGLALDPNNKRAKKHLRILEAELAAKAPVVTKKKEEAPVKKAKAPPPKPEKKAEKKAPPKPKPVKRAQKKAAPRPKKKPVVVWFEKPYLKGVCSFAAPRTDQADALASRHLKIFKALVREDRRRFAGSR